MSAGDAAPSPDAAGSADVLEPVVSMRGISKSFGHIQALRSVDLDLYGGEVVALVGDNGAGKSTLVKILAGVHPPDAGTIAYEGRHVTIPSPAAPGGLARVLLRWRPRWMSAIPATWSG